MQLPFYFRLITTYQGLPSLIMVQKATENDEELAELCHKCRNIVTYFKQSIKATDKLSDVLAKADW